METRPVINASKEANANESPRLMGKVNFATDSSYETARLAWNRVIDQHPEMIVFPESAADVVEALTFASQRSLPIAVQCTGHGLKRAANGALLINTSRMQSLRIDPQTQTAWVGAGVKWGTVLAQAQQHGLAPLLGSSPDVGAVGYSLGGGLGWLARKYGMCSDSVLQFEVVTPDSVLRQASPTENSDLFWALRGGGGGFGVVTGMEIRLFPVSQVYAGNLMYPAGQAKEVFQRFRSWVTSTPDELTTSIVLMNFPPLPELPPVLSGKTYAIVRGCYSGAAADGEALLAYWRDWQTPVIDNFKTIPFAQAATISQDPEAPGLYPMTGAWLNDLSDETADILIQHTLPEGGPPPVVFSEVRLAGGAIARVDPDSSAYTNRDEQYFWNSVGFAFAPEMVEPIKSHLARMHTALAPHQSGKTYMNFVEGDESRRRTRDGFSEQAYQRLQAVKAKYDPTNRFDHAFNIPPAVS